MDDRLTAALAALPIDLAWHVLLSAAALALGAAVALPLAVAAARRPGLRAVSLGLASAIQTIPALALLALFYPLLLLAARITGGVLPALGFLPALLALALFALLPMLRNAVEGLTGLDPAILEAADGVGMTPGQRLRLIEIPLAAPVVMAGVRTAAVWTIGTATLATTVGQPCLGNLIFSGLQTEDWVTVLVGCAASAALALGVDALLGLVQSGVARRLPVRIAIGGALLAAGIAAAAFALAPGSARATYTLGAKNFGEQFILARLIGARLEATGARVQYREGLGSAVAFRALAASDIDVYVDYSGTLWTNQMARADTPAPAAMRGEIVRWLAVHGGIGVAGALGFENAYALAMRRDQAAALGVRSIADLARAAPGLVLGADLEFLSRPEWRAIRTAYDLHFRETRAFAPTFMYRAIADRSVDAISAFSSDGRIAADDLVVLTDPAHAIPSYDALLLVSPRRARDPRLAAALAPLVGAIPVEAMRAANLMVDRDQDKQSPQAAARWLATHLARPAPPVTLAPAKGGQP